MTHSAKPTAIPCPLSIHHSSCTDPVRIVFEKSESAPNKPISQVQRQPLKALSNIGMERSEMAIHGRFIAKNKPILELWRGPFDYAQGEVKGARSAESHLWPNPFTRVGRVTGC